MISEILRAYKDKFVPMLNNITNALGFDTKAGEGETKKSLHTKVDSVSDELGSFGTGTTEGGGTYKKTAATEIASLSEELGNLQTAIGYAESEINSL